MARILVVDDTDQNLTLIELYLRGTEFEVAIASSGHQALDLCRQQSFDLILLDVVMPGIDGFEVCRRLKNDPRTAFVPVIFLTGHLGDESEKLAAYQLGAVDYIQKPLDREELVARIRVMLRLEDTRSRLDRENAALRRELGKVQSNLDEAAELLVELRQLQRAVAGGRDPDVLLVDRDLRVLAADPGVMSLLGAVTVGEPLSAAGHAAARLARLARDGVHSADLTLPGASEQTHVVQVRVRQLPEGLRLLLLQDVTGVRAIESRISDREPIELTPAPARREAAERGYSMTDFIGRSPRVEALTEQVARLRQTRSTVLIYGESGTGKELIARALHFDGQNRSAPFIPLHCGAIAPELIESELFGHEKGAFTGAQQSREGLFRAADGGTIFLDEIAETSLSVQVKLLRVLQRGEIRPVGANQPRIVDVRILAATNRDLLQLVREGRFREDLYYRLEVVTLHLPPLRERLEDLPMLVEYLLRKSAVRHDRTARPVRSVSRGAMERMLAYPWPGNVRELENAVERAFALGVGEVLQEDDLPRQVVRGLPALGPTPVRRPGAPTKAAPPAPDDDVTADLRSRREAAERQAILQALRDTHGDKVLAYQQLGMARSTFYRRLKELGL
ncbi:MAG TPA: sigma-54 dependent transcriptional regulator [Planctomycetota bacterium]|nr:sigma-54 dependent transcriptional regulator [Planctomycetota bacterium]